MNITLNLLILNKMCMHYCLSVPHHIYIKKNIYLFPKKFSFLECKMRLGHVTVSQFPCRIIFFLHQFNLGCKTVDDVVEVMSKENRKNQVIWIQTFFLIVKFSQTFLFFSKPLIISIPSKYYSIKDMIKITIFPLFRFIFYFK